MVGKAQVVVYSYQYMLNPKIYDIVTKQHVTPMSIVVFDEAHNIDNVCIESLSVRMGRPTLEDARSCCEQLQERLVEEKEATQARLNAEYGLLMAGLRQRGVHTDQGEDEVML